MKTLRTLSHTLAPIALTVLRVGTGAILAVHGWQKASDFASWTAMVDQLGIPAPSLFAALGMIAELGGGIALVLGLFTPIAAAMLLTNMLVAVFVVHWENGLMAADGGYEYALTLALVALYFLVRGPGPYSLDHALFGRRAAAREPLTRREAHA
jgi:putative oxidoreductase